MNSDSATTYSFELPLSDLKYNWREKAISFFERLGYEIVFQGDTEYVFKAGSRLGNFISFNPAKIERALVLKEENNTLFCVLKLSLDFRVDSRAEIEYARWEITSF